MDDLFNAFLGGDDSQDKDENPMADLIGGLLGGEGAGGGLADILGSVLGGGASEQNAIASGLADKLGVPPEVVQTVVQFVVSRLLSGGQGASAGGQRGFDLDSLLDEDYLKNSGVVDDLAGETGLDQETAVKSLQQVLSMLRK